MRRCTSQTKPTPTPRFVDVTVNCAGPWRWQFEGSDFTRFPVRRGHVEPREGVPQPLRELREFFERRAGFDAVRVVAFPVGEGGK
jgi:hypothetical protein